MSRLLRRRPSPALVVAVLALVLALGGTALATSGGGASRDAGAVAAKKRHHRPRLPSRIVRRYVARYVKHHPGPRGRRGATGPIGPQGPQGAAGNDATTQTGYVVTNHVHLGADEAFNLAAHCPAGFVPTGGGFDYGDYTAQGTYVADDQKIQVSTSEADDDNLDGVQDGWFIYAHNFGDGQGNNADAAVQVYAACAAGSTTSARQLRHARAVFAHQPALPKRR